MVAISFQPRSLEWFPCVQGIVFKLFKLGRRYIRRDNFRAESDHRAILTLSIPHIKALSMSNFQLRSKLDAKLDIVCKSKAEADKGERKTEGPTLGEITAKNKEEFGCTERSYVIFLFKGPQGLNRFNSDIAEGHLTLMSCMFIL